MIMSWKNYMIKYFQKKLKKKTLKYFKNCVKCSWIELKHFVREKMIILQKILFLIQLKILKKLIKKTYPEKIKICK